MPQELTGLKIRALRKDAGLTQAELARRSQISASYLNLIECNKRSVAGALLQRIGAGLGVDPAVLDGEAERRLAARLKEIAADPAISRGAQAPRNAEEFVGRSGDWAELMGRLYQAYHDQTQAVTALADRLNRDPFLGESVHRMLTHVTSIRSASEILDAGEALSVDDRRRFQSIIASDSSRLSETAQSLLSFFESANMRVRSATPMEEVDAFIFETDNYFPDLEMAAAEFRRGMRRHETPAEAAERMIAGDGATDIATAAETRRFSLVRQALEPLALARARHLVADHAALGTDDSRDLAVSALMSYATAAVLMPYEAFLTAAEDCRYDLDRLTGQFGVSYEQAAHRLASLRRPGQEGIRFAFMRSDPSGYVTKRLPLPDLPLPRYGTACPLWVIYSAFQTPGVTLRAFGGLPSGDDFLFVARAVEKRRPVVGMPRHLLSVMLACSASDASRTIYAEGIDRAHATMPVGTVCRLCPRDACGYRQEEPLIA